jgi:molybdopterin-containing oxidoreductase family iron-sulfur binding subunit
MQELPDPVTSLCWDNAAQVSPATAGQLGLESGSVVKLTYRDKSIEAPVWIVPGHADGAVTLPLGYGRATTVPLPVELDNKPEPLANGIGFDAYPLRRSAAFWFDAGLAVAATGRRWTFAVQQGDFSQEGRPHALSYTNSEWPEQGTHEVEEHRGPQPVILKPVDYSQEAYKWGMAIDLSRCTGCSACVIACQEENNIPVVGREQVQRRRSMHWLRIDRYFSGSAEEPQTITQPVACVHCESAPCEYVCPVNATVHSDEGLNEMVYNRCVGTRYCSNNCPYKVRRFNFLDYRGQMEPTEKMLMNPDVTVRARGVMEKCTYCVQRIERARIDARVDGRAIREGEVKSACQQSCPTEAIVFGNLNDPASRVSALHRDERRYDLLHDLGTRPRTAYLVRITNPNPELT